MNAEVATFLNCTDQNLSCCTRGFTCVMVLKQYV